MITELGDDDCPICGESYFVVLNNVIKDSKSFDVSDYEKLCFERCRIDTCKEDMWCYIHV